MSNLTKEYLGKEFGIGDPTKADPDWPSEPEAVWVIETGEYLLPDECAAIMNAMARELLSLRDAGDEEVENSHLDKLFIDAMHGIGVDESVNLEGCRSSQRSLEELHSHSIARGSQLREARAEIERLKTKAEHKSQQVDAQVAIVHEQQSQIADLTAERDRLKEKFSALEQEKSDAFGYARDMEAALKMQSEEHEKELAALKSAPGMSEVDALSKSAMETLAQIVLNATDSPAHAVDATPPGRITKMRDLIDAMRDLARRSIASRKEVVGLLDHILSCVITVKQENTSEWMEYIVEEVNKVNEAMGDSDRVELSRGGIVIVKGDSEIGEGNHA